ncbi:hypothetical protein DN068_01875 [Taibaiella soli]|uniref:NodB homology domain-containing protein n=2 Tax=Taibaiella soli TaxID=1649169 RepID=A0A2W2B257_9BACT|nr:hypothetical protein DN068_01875 [Taibaiella soli]
MRFHWLLPSIKGIPVLMYHRVWPGLNDGLTVTPEKLREQWSFLRKEGYHTLSLTDFLEIAEGRKTAPEKAMLLTFDDGYRNNLTYVYPLLKEFGWCATMFIITDTLDGTAQSETEALNEKLTVEELRSFDPAVMQLALHGHHHENFSNTPLKKLKEIMLQSAAVFDAAELPFHKVLAYPYGARPKETAQFDELKRWLKQEGYPAAFRIGGQVAKMPAPDMYEIRRIDIRGTDSMEDFRIKLKKGKLKPF